MGSGGRGRCLGWYLTVHAHRSSLLGSSGARAQELGGRDSVLFLCTPTVSTAVGPGMLLGETGKSFLF